MVSPTDRQSRDVSDVRVFIAHADPDDRRDLRHIVDDATGVRLVGDGAPERDALDGILSADPDVVVVHIHTTQAAIDLCRRMLDARPRIRCLVLASSDQDEAFIQAVLVGAAGVVRRELLVEHLRDPAATELREQARAVLDRYRTADVADALAELSNQQREVAYRVISGATNSEIAADLGLSSHTVRNYISRIMTRIGTRNRTELAVALATTILELERDPRPDPHP